MPMNQEETDFPDDRTANERRKELTKEQVEELELAGGVEGGMAAGSAGGPSESDAQAGSKGRSAQTRTADERRSED